MPVRPVRPFSCPYRARPVGPVPARTGPCLPTVPDGARTGPFRPVRHGWPKRFFSRLRIPYGDSCARGFGPWLEGRCPVALKVFWENA